jgi:hypothetical protein
MYSDPGSGLFFIQIIAATLGTVLFRFRRGLARLIGLADDKASDD